MKSSDKFILVLITSFTVYIIPELFFSNAVLYITGGIVGGSISNLLKLFQIDSHILEYIVWTLITLGIILVFLVVKNRIIKFVLFTIIFFLLYIIDLLMLNFFSNKYYINLRVFILIKAIILTFVFHLNHRFKNRRESKTT